MQAHYVDNWVFKRICPRVQQQFNIRGTYFLRTKIPLIVMHHKKDSNLHRTP